MVSMAATDTEEDSRAWEDLCQELKEAILSRVPLIYRARLKCVSKSWRDLATTLRLKCPPPTSSGLVIFFKPISNDQDHLHESSFINLRDQTNGQDCTIHRSIKHNLPWLIDSCNGLLLYAKNDLSIWSYFISSPVLDQLIALPIRPRPSIWARESLLFDGSDHHEQNFKVVCYLCEEFDVKTGTINCQIFSSQTWEWREKRFPLLNSHLLQEGFWVSDCFRPTVCTRGKLYWTWSLCMLVYDDEREFFKLIKLPKGNTTRRSRNGLSLLLWESEGRVHYCEPTNEGFCVWTYISEESWRPKTQIMLEQLRPQTIELVYGEDEKTIEVRIGRGLIRPCAFNEDLQVLYFQVPGGKIVSFSFETRKVAEVWSFGKPGEKYSMCYIYPFLFNSVNLNSRK